MSRPMEENVETISIESNLDQVRIVAKKVKSTCDSLSFSNVNAGEIELALVESLNNCIEHAYKFQTGNTIDVELVVNQTQLALHIMDYGIPMTDQLSEVLNTSDKTEVVMPDFDVSADELPTSGWGIALVRTLCDSINYERYNGHNKLSLSFELNT